MKTRMVLSHGTSMDLAYKILDAISRWRAENHQPFPGTIYMSVHDAQACAGTKPKMAVGHKFTLWGVPAVAQDIAPGHAYLVAP
jgi:hypothetical protein